MAPGYRKRRIGADSQLDSLPDTIANSITAAAATTGLPFSLLQSAKKAGCDAFIQRGRGVFSINCGKLILWMRAHPELVDTKAAYGEMVAEFGVTLRTAKKYVSGGCPIGVCDESRAWMVSHREAVLIIRNKISDNPSLLKWSWTHGASFLSGVSTGVALDYARRLGAPKSPICFWLWNLARKQSRKAFFTERLKQRRKEEKAKLRERFRSDLEFRQKVRESAARYRAANPDKITQLRRNWNRKNAEYVRQRDRAAYRRPERKIKACLRRSLQRAVEAQGTHRQHKTWNTIGCTPAFLKSHLEGQFKKGMTWDNHGAVWHIDHILPISKFNLKNPDQQKLANHYTNLRPMFAEENLLKGDKILQPIQVHLPLVAA